MRRKNRTAGIPQSTWAFAVALFLATSLGARRAEAQGRFVSISGVVRTEAGFPLGGVEVALDRPRGESAPRRTDEQGRFMFGLLGRGTYTIRLRHVGYYPEERSITLGDSSVAVSITLRSVPSALDTVRVLGLRIGVAGVVAAAGDLRGLAGAAVTLLRTRIGTTTNSLGRFELLSDVKAGPHIVFAKADSFASEMLSVLVPDSGVVNVALVLKAMSAPGMKRIAMPLMELEQRAHWIGRGAALVSAEELAEFRGESLTYALLHAASIRNRGLFTGVGCVLINGWQRGRSLDEFSIEEVEALEYYRAGTDYTGTLADRGCPSSDAIPRLSSRPFSKAQRNRDRPGALTTVVVWLKR